jgi:hypothetical protein
VKNKVHDEVNLAYTEQDCKDLQVFGSDGRWRDLRWSSRWENLIQDLPKSVVLSIIIKICFKIGNGEKPAIDVVGLGYIANSLQAPIGNEAMEVLDLRDVVRLRHCALCMNGVNI